MSGNSTLPDDYVDGSYWYHAPNKGAPIAFAILFGISGIIHAYQCFKYRCWKVSGVLPWAATLFVGAFVVREVGAYNYDNRGVFIASTVIFLTPRNPVYEGANYFLLGRILYYVPDNSPLHPGRVVSTFVGIDVVQDEIDLRKSPLKAAFLLQIVSMCTFVAITARYHYRCYKTGTLPNNLRTVLIVLYISCTLITVRTIYRTAEYFEATSLNVYADVLHISTLLKREFYFWVFEAMFMFLNTVLLNAFHPSRFLPVNNKIYLAQDGVTEIESPGYEDKRHFVWTLFDPFGVVGIITKRGEPEKFWENGKEQKVKA
ncbi:hypothetical protein EDD18DRAFT_1345536 [Armillaria luteobubalina]|uniref:RTA1 domain protein n=1 Tax=Armillaria luteobubalina TaxID=153913 RepID=A0AA39QGX6_9AGAR|nr:hypothetical protein EDD18DRAFT_1345536 [Armillaria luteobubalina]